MEADKNPFPKIEVIPNPLKLIAGAIGWLCTMQQLSPVSEHFQHPFDAELYDQLELDYDAR